MGNGRVVVFGYGELGISAVETLQNLGAQISAMVVPSNRTGPNVETCISYAQEHQIPLLYQPPRKAIDPFLVELSKIEPEFILVWSYTMILPESVIRIPSGDAINVHGGLLPQYRGGHVMQWAIINGEKETGVTLHYMDQGIDTGPIIAQGRFPISHSDDAVSVQDNLKNTGVELLRTWWPKISCGTAPRITQEESTAHYYPLRTVEDGKINWNHSCGNIHNLVRALVAPWPGAFTFCDDKKIIVRKTSTTPHLVNQTPGLIKSVNQQGATVATGQGDVIIQTIEIDGQSLERQDLTAYFSVGDILRD